MQDENFRVFRPRISGRARKEKMPALLSVAKHLGKSGGGLKFSGSGQVRKAGMRRVIVKARIVKMSAHGKIAANLHIRYIEREGVEVDGSKGVLYGRKDDFDREEIIHVKPDEERQFRFIVSPEDADKIDLTKFTRELMDKMEVDLGGEKGPISLEWGAVNHYNTDNPHVHIVVRGIDRNGNKVFINPEYIAHGMRNRAEEIVTKELGKRTEQEIEAQRDREVSAGRYTGLDKQLQRIEIDGKIDLKNLNKSSLDSVSKRQLTARLEYLNQAGLADKIEHGVYSMSRDWDKSLRDIAKNEEIKKNIDRVAHGDPSKYRINAITEKGVTGIVLSVGMSNELYDRYYAIVQEPTGTTHYIDLSAKQIESVQKGQFVTLKETRESWLKNSDYNIVSQARKNDWFYDPAKHIQDIGSDTVILKSGKTVSSREFVDAHVQRLQTLKQTGLVAALETGEWRIDPALTQKLEEKNLVEGPKRRLFISSESSQSLDEQVTYRGRTWIDRYTAKTVEESGFSRYGLGHEMRSAIQRRVMMLQEMGIDPIDPARGKKLDAIERGELADRVKLTGYTYKPLDEEAKVRGTLQGLPSTANGSKYAQVVDLRSKEFTLVPWQKDFDKLAGKNVELAKISGRFTARGINRGMER